MHYATLTNLFVYIIAVLALEFVPVNMLHQFSFIPSGYGLFLIGMKKSDMWYHVIREKRSVLIFWLPAFFTIANFISLSFVAISMIFYLDALSAFGTDGIGVITPYNTTITLTFAIVTLQAHKYWYSWFFCGKRFFMYCGLLMEGLTIASCATFLSYLVFSSTASGNPSNLITSIILTSIALLIFFIIAVCSCFITAAYNTELGNSKCGYIQFDNIMHYATSRIYYHFDAKFSKKENFEIKGSYRDKKRSDY